MPSFNEQLARGEKVTAKIVYDVSIEGGGFEHLSSTSVEISRLPDKRLDIMYDSGDTEAFLLVGGELTVCRDGDCGPPSGNEREEVLSRLSGIGIPVAAELFNGAASDLRPLPGRTLAGLDAECFEESDESILVAICLDGESGVVLSMDIENTRTELRITVTATSVDFDVTDEDFALPSR